MVMDFLKYFGGDRTLWSAEPPDMDRFCLRKAVCVDFATAGDCSSKLCNRDGFWTCSAGDRTLRCAELANTDDLLIDRTKLRDILPFRLGEREVVVRSPLGLQPIDF